MTDALALSRAESKFAQTTPHNHPPLQPRHWRACSASGAAAATANNAEQTAFDYFVHKGLTKVQAAGIVGNLMQESNVRPKAVQSGAAGRGIAQWGVGQRWDKSAKDNVVWFANLHKEDRRVASGRRFPGNDHAQRLF